MSGLIRVLQKVQPAVSLKTLAMSQRARLSSKPPKNPVGAVESVFVFGIMSFTILAPAGWVLANVGAYKKRSS